MNPINIGLNRNLEFINSVMLTSKYNELMQAGLGVTLMTDTENAYTQAIREFFAPYKSHGAYGVIESSIPNGFTFSRPVELALSVDDDFMQTYSLSGFATSLCGGTENIHRLLYVLKNLFYKSNYSEFYKKHKNYYTPYLDKLTAIFATYDIIGEFERLFGATYDEYEIVISNLDKGSYGIAFEAVETRKLCAVLSLWEQVLTDDALLPRMIELIVHELSHSFVNPMTAKYMAVIDDPAGAWKRLKNNPNYNVYSGYGDLEECVNEHIVRSAALHVLKRLGFTEYVAQGIIAQEKNGFPYIREIIERIDHPHIFDVRYFELMKLFDESEVEK
jgi:hypothetical protein